MMRGIALLLACFALIATPTALAAAAPVAPGAPASEMACAASGFNPVVCALAAIACSQPIAIICITGQ